MLLAYNDITGHVDALLSSVPYKNLGNVQGRLLGDLDLRGNQLSGTIPATVRACCNSPVTCPAHNKCCKSISVVAGC